ncbi:MAG: hypothetical protein L6R40_003904 [Gallowayella cf. fulva]|nr:MAG: hypothetical protein L6R40_003904 [Xanthomendoza cf. fulva]
MSLFDRVTPATSSSNQFGSGTSSLFGGNNQQNQQKPEPKSIFSSLGQPAQQPASQSGGLFGSSGQSSQQNNLQTGGLFGSSQPQQTEGLLGSSKPQQTGGLFGSNLFGGQSQPDFGNQQNSQQQSSSLFGAKPLGQGQSSLFGPQQQQQQQQQSQPSLFGATQQQQPQQQQIPQQASVFGQQNPSIFKQVEVWPRPRSVADQIEVAFQKWNPDSQISLFQTYIYNFTDPKFVPFCQPGEADNPTKWEEAMSKKPHPGAVPVLVKGFHQLGQRMLLQKQLLQVLQGRLHEINNGLTEMLRRHDLEISVRAAEARKRHLKLNQQCVRLATKVQVLRHRGYAMDSTEEELQKKLLALERKVMDPALNGRGEEIWARMVSKQEQTIDDEVMKKATKILEDYSSQLAHLAKELEQLQKEFADWNDGRPEAAGIGARR